MVVLGQLLEGSTLGITQLTAALICSGGRGAVLVSYRCSRVVPSCTRVIFPGESGPGCYASARYVSHMHAFEFVGAPSDECSRYGFVEAFDESATASVAPGVGQGWHGG